MIHVEKDGRFKFKLSPWPKEAHKQLGEWDFKAKSAHLKIGNAEAAVDVIPSRQHAELTLNIKRGTTCMQAWFASHKQGEIMGAEFVYVERTGPSDADAIKDYVPSEPDELLKPLKGDTRKSS